MHLKPVILVEIKCSTKERLLNLFRHKNIFMWNINAVDGGFTGLMNAKDYKKTKGPMHKCHGKIKIVKKYGVSFVLFKYRKHYTFLAGMFIALLIMNILSLHVWNVSFEGNSFYTDDVLNRYMISNGIHAGIFINDVDCSLMEEKIRKTFNYITWVSVQKQGTNLIVNIKENSVVDKNSYNNEPRDIIASVDGTVKSIITRSGTPLVKPGQEVKKGDILVSGNIDIKNDADEIVSQRQVAADSDIEIEYEEDYYDTLNRTYDKFEKTGKSRKHFIIQFGNLRMETGLNCPYLEYDTQGELNNIKLMNNLTLPVSIGYVVYSETKSATYEYSNEEAADVLNNKYMYYINKLKENNVQILDYSVKINEDESGYAINAKIKAMGALIQYTPVAENNEELKEELEDERN